MAENAVVSPGYYEGVLDLYYAVMTTADSTAAAPTYDEPKVLAKTINVTVTPNYREGSRYASNSKVRNISRLDSYEVTISADQVVAAVRRELLGRTTDAKGVDILDGKTDAPYVALGFALTKDNNTKEYWWLYKGKFQEIEVNADTAADDIDYKDVELSGTFDRRIFDDAIAAVADEEASDKDAATLADWFKAVYERTNASG